MGTDVINAGWQSILSSFSHKATRQSTQTARSLLTHACRLTFANVLLCTWQTGTAAASSPVMGCATRSPADCCPRIETKASKLAVATCIAWAQFRPQQRRLPTLGGSQQLLVWHAHGINLW